LAFSSIAITGDIAHKVDLLDDFDGVATKCLADENLPFANNAGLSFQPYELPELGTLGFEI
jgi:hypothetical protein